MKSSAFILKCPIVYVRDGYPDNESNSPCIRHCSKCFVCIKSLNPHNSLEMKAIIIPFYREEIEEQRGK